MAERPAAVTVDGSLVAFRRMSPAGTWYLEDDPPEQRLRWVPSPWVTGSGASQVEHLAGAALPRVEAAPAP